ncbi:uncharacterized protein K452DRAFT_281870 [Aplosporella prunicola CBS 121167]|uniref:Uncharacterized protein n=1 Tax=Aplosporella prunicola CBS 121167 TaxID=1176127 RepID=A0A6A6AU33_9PEZI|nr:uncharacterized protein K452DRAFT_281870 [Aplosporella prunicola CBS 121167]KAF2135200.1 hypothetical protein K452DRAFT_281870 [Aplosporella prunicola CBS 121167]
MSYPAETNSGEVTSWIPLTTKFPSVSGCASSFRLNGPSLVVFDPGYGLDINTIVRCQPPAVTTWWEQARLGLGGAPDHTALSILPLMCPDYFHTVKSSIKDGSSTLAMCCPSGYTLAHDPVISIAGDCVSVVTPGMILTYASTASSSTENWKTMTTTLTRSSTVGAIAILGWNVQIPMSTAAPSATSAAAPSTASGSSPASTSTATPHPPQASQSLRGPQTSQDNAPSGSQVLGSIHTSTSPSPIGLTTGTKVGIGLGVSLGVIGIIALIVAIILLRRHRRPPKDEDTDTAFILSQTETPKAYQTPPVQKPPQYAGLYELSGHNFIRELPNNEVEARPVELEASTKRLR